MEGKWFAGGLQVTVLRLAPIPTPDLAPLPQVDFSAKTTARAVWSFSNHESDFKSVTIDLCIEQ